MSETENIRLERIRRLLKELEYEVTRGMMEREIEEEMGYRFYVPISKAIHGGAVFCEFRTRPVTRHQIGMPDHEPRLRVVESVSIPIEGSVK